MPASSTSSAIPKAVWGGVTAVLMALAALLTHLAQQPVAPAVVDAPRHSSEPPPLPPREPTTDPTEIRLRLIEDHERQDYAAFNDRAALLETRACLLEQELRAAYARLVSLGAGKRGAEARKTFEQETGGWAACFLQLNDVRARKSLREAADSALLR